MEISYIFNKHAIPRVRASRWLIVNSIRGLAVFMEKVKVTIDIKSQLLYEILSNLFSDLYNTGVLLVEHSRQGITKLLLNEAIRRFVPRSRYFILLLQWENYFSLMNHWFLPVRKYRLRFRFLQLLKLVLVITHEQQNLTG